MVNDATSKNYSNKPTNLYVVPKVPPANGEGNEVSLPIERIKKKKSEKSTDALGHGHGHGTGAESNDRDLPNREELLMAIKAQLSNLKEKGQRLKYYVEEMVGSYPTDRDGKE